MLHTFTQNKMMLRRDVAGKYLGDVEMDDDKVSGFMSLGG